MPVNMPKTSIICNIPGPTMDSTVNRMSNPGKARKASTNLCTMMSYLPPKNPEGTPIIEAITTVMEVPARPTIIEMRAP